MAFRAAIVRGPRVMLPPMHAVHAVAGRMLVAAALLAAGCGRPAEPPPPAAGPAAPATMHADPKASPTPGAVAADVSAAFALRCAALPAAQPEAAAVPATPLFDDTRSLAELTDMYERATGQHQTMGLTQTHLAYSTRLAANGMRDGERSVCMRVKVQVDITLAPMTVFVARELAGDPCRHAAVLGHEMRHVEVHAAFLRDAADRLAARLLAADTGRVRHAASPQSLQDDAAGEIAAIVGAAQDEDRALLAELHRTIDTPEEYARVSGLCDTASVPIRPDEMRAGSDRR